MLTAALLTISLLGQPPPEIVGAHWFNTGDGRSITLESRKGRVTVVEFWTFKCANCQANLRAYNRVYAKFRPKGVEMIGIHTPELKEERDPVNVQAAIKRWDIKYPVVIDNDSANWIAWKQQYWPTIYVVDKYGQIAFKWEGELAWHGATGEQQLDDAIASALKS